jgi:hypothetical protein
VQYYCFECVTFKTDICGIPFFLRYRREHIPKSDVKIWGLDVIRKKGGGQTSMIHWGSSLRR